MKLSANFTFDTVRHDTDNNVHLVIGLTAPEVEATKRPPLCIILVADNSGSMDGEKLHYARLSMRKLVDNLAPGDSCGLVVFSTDARVQFKAQKMTAENKEALKNAINGIRVEGGTNFAAGMMLGCEVANNLDMPAATIVRVIMFSDGQPERGIAKDAAGLTKLLQKQRERATVSMFGFGPDADHNLLTALSTEGAGNYAHVANPDSALSAFGKELGGLLSSYADDIVLTINPHAGHKITEVLSDVDVDEEIDGEITIKVPSMLAEEQQNIVLSMKLDAQKSPGPRAVNAAEVKLGYRILENGEPVRKTAETKAKVQFVKNGDEQKKPTKAVDEIVARAQLAKAQLDAEKAVASNNFAAAQQHFGLVQNSLVDRGHDHLTGLAQYVGSMYESQNVYGASSGNRNVLRSAMTRGGYRVSHLSAQDEGVLRSAGLSMSNASQAATSQSFTQDADDQQMPPADPADVSAMGMPIVHIVPPVVGSGITVDGTAGPLGSSQVWTGGYVLHTPTPVDGASTADVGIPGLAKIIQEKLDEGKKAAESAKPATSKSKLTKSRVSKW